MLLALSVVLAPLLFVGGPSGFTARSVQLGWSLGHGILFFCLSAGLTDHIPETVRTRSAKYALFSLGATIILAALVEWLQGFVGRQRSVEDVLISLAGTAVALLVTGPTQTGSRRVRPGRALLAAGIVSAACAPTGVALWDEARA
jgi:VanZ family protein